METNGTWNIISIKGNRGKGLTRGVKLAVASATALHE